MPSRPSRMHQLDVLLVLFAKEFKVRYKGSALGYVWSVLHPLAFAAVFYLVFGVIARIDVENYPLFLITGLFPWQWFQNSVTASNEWFLGNAPLIKRVRFDRAILVLAGALNDMTHFLLALPVVLVFMALAGLAPAWSWLVWVPLLCALQLLLTLGLALAVASLNLLLRDLERVVGIGMMLWFYLTPVLYPPSMVPDEMRPFLWANPMAGLVTCWRSLFLESTVPAGPLAAAALAAAVSFAAGYAIYRSTEWRFSEVV